MVAIQKRLFSNVSVERPYEDLTGKKFSKLVVIDLAGRDKFGSLVWDCICDCGNRVASISSHKLRSGRKKSCGCLAHEHSPRRLESYRRQSLSKIRPIEETSLARLKRKYRDGAAKRDLDFTLSDIEQASLFFSDCCYCGQPPSAVLRLKGKNRSRTYNGIDRIDNSIGYVSGNVCTCCRQCNIAKSTLSEGEFIRWAFRLVGNLTGQGYEAKNESAGTEIFRGVLGAG